MKSHCYIGGKKQLSHIVLHTDIMLAFQQIIRRLFDKAGALSSI